MGEEKKQEEEQPRPEVELVDFPVRDEPGIQVTAK